MLLVQLGAYGVGFRRASALPHRMGPYDQHPTSDTEDETPPPLAEEDIKKKASVGEDELIKGVRNWERSLLRRETLGRDP